MIKVSVLIPMYNAEKTIERAIKSVPNRSDIEIVIYNDGSIDKTYEEAVFALRKFKGQAVTITCEKNLGVAHAVNQLMDSASGEYIVLLGADDWFIKENFEKVMEKLDSDLVYFDLEINDGSVFHLDEKSKMGYCGSVKFMRRDFVGDLRCDEKKKAGEDYYFYREMLKKNPSESFSNVIVKHYNFPREGSLSWKQIHGEFKPEEI